MNKAKKIGVTAMPAFMRLLRQGWLAVFASVAFADEPNQEGWRSAWQQLAVAIDIKMATLISVISFVVMVVIWKSKITTPFGIWVMRFAAFVIILINVLIWFAQV